jgi:hypothetical protein
MQHNQRWRLEIKDGRLKNTGDTSQKGWLLCVVVDQQQQQPGSCKRGGREGVGATYVVETRATLGALAPLRSLGGRCERRRSDQFHHCWVCHINLHDEGSPHGCLLRVCGQVRLGGVGGSGGRNGRRPRWRGRWERVFVWSAARSCERFCDGPERMKSFTVYKYVSHKELEVGVAFFTLSHSNLHHTETELPWSHVLIQQLKQQHRIRMRAVGHGARTRDLLARPCPRCAHF